MDTREKLIDARIGMLALVDELKNISRACQRAGISRTHYYDIKAAFERYGREGLAPTSRRRRRPRRHN
jgi:molybdenum-dependent DNA-binding transcriptional regulator ModE